MAYDGQCGSCWNFQDPKSDKPYDNAYYVKGFCTWYKSFYYPDDSCNHYHSRGGSPSGNCYITTILCNRLGYDDHCDELETLRNFRNSVLQKDIKYQDILYEYDVVGPEIAKELQIEDIFIVKALFFRFIQPIVHLLKEDKSEEAIQKYAFMTKSLEEYYGITFDFSKKDDYDYTKGGHGIFSSKVKK